LWIKPAISSCRARANWPKFGKGYLAWLSWDKQALLLQRIHLPTARKRESVCALSAVVPVSGPASALVRASVLVRAAQALISGYECKGGGNGEVQSGSGRTDTVTKQSEIIVEAASAEQARKFILADLEVDPGSYDDDLRAVESDCGDIKVTTTRRENRHDPAQIPRSLAS
jgi:hypothetical protein